MNERQHATREMRRQQVERCLATDMTVREWCELNHVDSDSDGPEIVVTVHGFDLDFPDVARRLRALADHLASHNLV